MYCIASLEELRLQMGITATSDDVRLLTILETASTLLERFTRRRFVPYLVSIPHDYEHPTELALRADLLTLTSITNGDGSSISTDDVQILRGDWLRLNNGAAFTYEEAPDEALSVTGLWGYHPDWDNAWSDSADSVQDASLGASDTTITVTDADAGTLPRFQVGQLLRIESEYLWVTAVDTGNNQLTVIRGAQGTTAAAHAQTTAIEIYQASADVKMLCLQWAHWLYKYPDVQPDEIPAPLMQTISGMQRITVNS